ncbi:hypothetical protein BKA93DRAFT_830178 [Sparassis latifolia]
MSPAVTCYENRANGDFFHDLLAFIQSLGKLTLSGVFYPGDFSKVITSEGNYSYVWTADKFTEFRTNIFGEVRPTTDGTNLSAKGNHRPGDNASPVTDDSKIRNILVLDSPKMASNEIYQTFREQISTLNEVRVADEQEEAK